MTEQQSVQSKTKDDLINQKVRLEEEIRRVDRMEHIATIREVIPKVHDVADSLTHIQNQLNMAWKRINQIEAELQVGLAKLTEYKN